MINFTFKEKDNERVKNIDIEQIISKRTLINKKKLKSLKINSNISNINKPDNNFHLINPTTNNQTYLCTFSPDKIVPQEIITATNNTKSFKKGNRLPKLNIKKKNNFPLITETNLIQNNSNKNTIFFKNLNPNFSNSNNNININLSQKFNNINSNNATNTSNNPDFVKDFTKFKLPPQKNKNLKETKKNTEENETDEFLDLGEINEQIDDILNNIDNDGGEEVNQKIKELSQTCTNFNFSSNIHEDSKTNNSSKENNKSEKFEKIGNQTQKSFMLGSNPNLLSSDKGLKMNKLCLSSMTGRRKYEEEENNGEDFILDVNKKFFANYTNYGNNFFSKNKIKSNNNNENIFD